MGYCVEMSGSTFKILDKNVDEVIKRLRLLGETNDDLMWIDSVVLTDRGRGLYELFEEIRYPLFKESDCYRIDYFSGEKLGDDLEIFQCISDLVEPSYIEYVGDDGEKFRFVFNGKTCTEVYPKVIWE